MQPVQLYIPRPCHENWVEMNPTEKGRFCKACSKEVIDFSKMSDSEVLNYFSRGSYGNVCGRAYPDQLERVISMPDMKKRKVWYWNYITLLILLFSKSSIKAQGKMVATSVKKDQCSKPLAGMIAYRPLPRNIVLVIKDNETYLPLNKAVLKIKANGIDNLKTVYTDQKGLYSVNNIGHEDTYIINISVEGFETREIVITTKDNNNEINETIAVYMLKAIAKPDYKKLEEVLLKKTENMLGVLVGAMGVRIIRTRSQNIFTKRVETFITDSLKIYPNPGLRGNRFDVALKLKQAGEYFIQITDATGIILLHKKINAKGKVHTESIQSDSRWANGIYYIRAFDTQNKLISIKSFIVSSNGF